MDVDPVRFVELPVSRCGDWGVEYEKLTEKECGK